MTPSTRIDSDDLSIEEVFKDFYVVPDFQREFVWTESHVEKLLQDVYDEFYIDSKTLSSEGEYFIGSIVTCVNESGLYQLIDGQQRLTTNYLTICVIRDLLHELQETPPEAIQGMIYAVSMNPTSGEDIHRYRLELQYEDSQDVLEVLAGNKKPIEDIAQSTRSVKYIVQAYQTIKEFLLANFDNQSADLKVFAAALSKRVKLIRIVTPDISSALKLFETINDRGVGLNAMDLLKNLLFIRTSPDEYQILKEHWKKLIDILDNDCKEKPLRFLRYFVMANYEMPPNKPILREDDIYKWFTDHQSDTGITSDPLGFVETLITSARAYAQFVKGNNNVSEPVRYLRNIAKLSNQAKQHFILLLASLHMPAKLFEKLCQNIEYLFFCYLIIREPTRNFERMFARWAKELRQVNDESSLQNFLEKYIEVELSAKASTFDFAFTDLSATKIQQYRMHYILAKIAQYVDESAYSRQVPLDHYYDSIQVEHILPRNPSAEVMEQFDKPEMYDHYRYLFGNLTLLEKSINSSVSNNGFSEKKLGFSQSQFLITNSIVKRPNVGVNTQINRATQDLKQFSEWTSDSIIKRQEMLIRFAHKVWNVPIPEGSEYD